MQRSAAILVLAACTVGDAVDPEPSSELPPSDAGNKVGSIEVFGFTNPREAMQVIAALEALPPSLTRDAPFDVTRDPVSQAGCPDPTRTPLGTQIDPACGYAGIEVVGARYRLALRDAALVTYPYRFEHVLADFATRIWYLAHADEVLAMRRDAWQPACFACSADPDEPCAATNSDNQIIQVLRDFTSSASATLLGDKAWGRKGVRWVTAGGSPCTDAARQAWIRDRLVAERPARLVVRAIDVTAKCPPGTPAVRYTLTTPAGSVPVSKASLGTGDSARIFYYDGDTASPTPTIRRISMTAGMSRVVAWASQDFALNFIECAQ